ncbi:ornithine cyclodeaminase family protein [Spiractinospora alimapuensis]|uniref:ornithine cyclodeaminase family protein n=1 Tax=Spiractinospora alimapuensis TaxID=2820884 RepID=UPI001F472BC0|nr:ornithine cyclodeaminase family protein [Spiractinospora alimapuensis]QVQ51111.1 ornithine cyclodeaminase family protein [Spiractinospora alimapuensis]
MRCVGNAEVRRLVTMERAVDALRSTFTEIGRSASPVFDCPPRLALGDGATLVMTARHVPTGATVTKSLSVELSRDPAIVGSVAWMDPLRTEPLVVEAAAVTTLRTGAIAGLGTDLLAPPDADRMAIVGSGAQAPDQVRAVHAVRPLRELRVVSRRPENAERLAASLRPELPGTAITVASTVRDAVADMPIVTCATSAAEPVLDTVDLAPDAHVNGIGSFRPSMRELPEDLLAGAEVVMVEQRAAALEESGEIRHAVTTGGLRKDDVRELPDVLREPWQRSGGRTVFKSVGVGIHDWAVTRLIAETLDMPGVDSADV